MAIAQRVYDYRGEEEKKEKRKWMKEKAAVMAAALAQGEPATREGQRGPETRGRGRGRGQPLGRNQCAICKKNGHWRRQCPQNQAGRMEGGQREQRGQRGGVFGGRYARGPDRRDFVGLASMEEYHD